MMLINAQEISGTFIPDNADQPRALAELFCNLFGNEQAQFFNHVAELSHGYDMPDCFQWANMHGDEPGDYLSNKARATLAQILDKSPRDRT